MKGRYLRMTLDFTIELEHQVRKIPLQGGAEYLSIAAAEAAYELLPDSLKRQGVSCLLDGAVLSAQLTNHSSSMGVEAAWLNLSETTRTIFRTYLEGVAKRNPAEENRAAAQVLLDGLNVKRIK